MATAPGHFQATSSRKRGGCVNSSSLNLMRLKGTLAGPDTCALLGRSRPRTEYIGRRRGVRPLYPLVSHPQGHICAKMAAAMPSPAEAGLSSQAPSNVLPPAGYTQFTNGPLPVAAGGQTVSPATVSGAMAPGQYQLTSAPVQGHGSGVAVGTGTSMQPIGAYSHPVSPTGYYQPLQGTPSQAQVLLGPPVPMPYHQPAGDPPPPTYQQSVAPMNNGFAASPMPPQAPIPTAVIQQPAPPGYPQQPTPVSAWDVAKIVGGRFIDLKCFSRLPGLKPGPAQMVHGILDLALIWVDLDAYLSIPEATALGLGSPLNFDACWHMGQEHRSFWEQTFCEVRPSVVMSPLHFARGVLHLGATMA